MEALEWSDLKIISQIGGAIENRFTYARARKSKREFRFTRYCTYSRFFVTVIVMNKGLIKKSQSAIQHMRVFEK